MLLETSIVQPKYFKIDENRNRKIELHMMSISGNKTFTNLALLKQRSSSPQKLTQNSLISSNQYTNQRRKHTLDVGNYYENDTTDLSYIQDISSMQLQIKSSKNHNNNDLFKKQSTKDTTCNSPIQKSMVSSKRNSQSQIDINNLGTFLGSSVSPRDKQSAINTKQQLILDDDYIQQEENKENDSMSTSSNGAKKFKTNLVYYNDSDQQLKLQPHRSDGFSGQSSLIFTGNRFNGQDNNSNIKKNYNNNDINLNLNGDQLQDKKLYVGGSIDDDDKFSFQYTVKNRSKKNSLTDMRKGSINSEANSNGIQIQLERLGKEDEIC